MSPTTIVRLVITLLVNVSLTFLLLPLDAIDIIAVGREYLLTQLASANHRIEVHKVNNLPQRFIRILAVEMAKLIIIVVSLEKSFQYLVSSIDVARLHGNLHRAEHLEPFEGFQHSQCQKYEQRQDHRHVPTSDTCRQTNSKADEQHGRLFRIANVRAEAHE